MEEPYKVNHTCILHKEVNIIIAPLISAATTWRWIYPGSKDS